MRGHQLPFLVFWTGAACRRSRVSRLAGTILGEGLVSKLTAIVNPALTLARLSRNFKDGESVETSVTNEIFTGGVGRATRNDKSDLN